MIKWYVKTENIKIHVDIIKTVEYIEKYKEFNKYFEPLRKRLN